MRKRKGPAMLLFTVLLIMPLVFPALGFEVIVQSYSDEFPSASSPAFAYLPNGSLLTVFSNIVDGEICGKLSQDNGLTWTERFSIKNSTSQYYVFSASLLTVDNKTFLFYLRIEPSLNPDDLGFGSVWKTETVNNGETWQTDERIDFGHHNYTLPGYSSLRMRNGTLLVPISWNEGNNSYPYQHYNASVLRSDDGGNTWIEGAAMNVPEYIGADIVYMGIDEPSVVELSNSSLYCVLRTYLLGMDPSVHLYSISNDYGLTWSVCRKITEMYAFNSSPAIFRYSWNPNIIITAWINRSFMDPIQRWATNNLYLRRPLAVAYSMDEGSTWKSGTVIDTGSKGAMNEPSLLVTNNGGIILGYRRYDGPSPSDSVSRIFRLTIFADAKSLAEAFGQSPIQNPFIDMNSDGTIDIFDAILFASSAQFP